MSPVQIEPGLPRRSIGGAVLGAEALQALRVIKALVDDALAARVFAGTRPSRSIEENSDP